MYETYGIKTRRAPRREMLAAQKQVRRRVTAAQGVARVAAALGRASATSEPTVEG